MTPRLKGFVLLFGITALALLVVSSVLGVWMRFSQAGWLLLPPANFYQFLTLHGLGMLVFSLMTSMAMSWWLLGQMPGNKLSYPWLTIIYALILLGVVGVILATLVGRVGTGWTMLLPLPLASYSTGQWSNWATELLIDSVIVVGVSILLFFMLVLREVVRTTGSLDTGLGWAVISGNNKASLPAYIIPLSVSSLTGLLTTVVGAIYLILMHLEFSFPDAFFFDRLLAKNMVYAFGHTIFNITIYYAAAAVYLILPKYTLREWKTSRLLAVSWNISLVMVLLAFFHHVYMDFVQAPYLQIIGQVGSFGVAIPPALVTIFGAMGYIWRSGMKWQPVPAFIFVGLFGWVVGGAAAGLDGTIVFNFQLHNTLWVPAHFHTYLLLGVLLFFLAFVVHSLPEMGRGGIKPRMAGWTLALILVGGIGQLSGWYLSGLAGSPRRYASLPTGVEAYSLVSSIGIVLVVLGGIVFAFGLIRAFFGPRPEV